MPLPPVVPIPLREDHMCQNMTRLYDDCRVILTDLSSLNGTWVNRARLRAHADSQIQAQDVIAFGSSDATFQLVALDPSASSLPSAVEVAEAMVGGARHAPDHSEPASAQHAELCPYPRDCTLSLQGYVSARSVLYLCAWVPKAWQSVGMTYHIQIKVHPSKSMQNHWPQCITCGT